MNDDLSHGTRRSAMIVGVIAGFVLLALGVGLRGLRARR